MLFYCLIFLSSDKNQIFFAEDRVTRDIRGIRDSCKLVKEINLNCELLIIDVMFFFLLRVKKK